MQANSSRTLLMSVFKYAASYAASRSLSMQTCVSGALRTHEWQQMSSTLVCERSKSNRSGQLRVHPKATSCAPSITAESICLLFTYHVGKTVTQLLMETLLCVSARWPQHKQGSVEQG